MKAKIREACRIDFFPSVACKVENSLIGGRPQRSGDRFQPTYTFWRARRFRKHTVVEYLESPSDHHVNVVAQNGDGSNRLVGRNLRTYLLEVNVIRYGLP